MSEDISKNLMLKWNEELGKFNPLKSEGDMKEGIFLEFIPDKNHWKFFYIKGASLINRRTALRAANGISKVGYLHPETDLRYGVNLKLKEENSPYEDMPQNIIRAQRTWYDPSYKKQKPKKEE
ncbi:MAG: hypothetical protein ACQERB_14975 [Promethearchaeati archaeon]